MAKWPCHPVLFGEKASINARFITFLFFYETGEIRKIIIGKSGDHAPTTGLFLRHYLTKTLY